MMGRISEDFARWAEEALEACAPGEKVKWDVTFQVMQTPNGSAPVMVLLLQIPSPVLGQKMNHLVILGVDDVNEPVVGDSVRSAMEVLRTRRSEALTIGVAH